MKKAMQNFITAVSMDMYDLAMREYKQCFPVPEKGIRLRTCSAEVFETPGFYLLKSYNTIVAVIAKQQGVCYDVLRVVYGYTSTSAQHIAKFRNDYLTMPCKSRHNHWIAR